MFRIKSHDAGQNSNCSNGTKTFQTMWTLRSFWGLLSWKEIRHFATKMWRWKPRLTTTIFDPSPIHYLHNVNCRDCIESEIISFSTALVQKKSSFCLHLIFILTEDKWKKGIIWQKLQLLLNTSHIFCVFANDLLGEILLKHLKPILLAWK